MDTIGHVTSLRLLYIEATSQGETSRGTDSHQLLPSKWAEPLDFLTLQGIIVNLW